MGKSQFGFDLARRLRNQIVSRTYVKNFRYTLVYQALRDQQPYNRFSRSRVERDERISEVAIVMPQLESFRLALPKVIWCSRKGWNGAENLDRIDLAA
jgi:hypothetical protein